MLKNKINKIITIFLILVSLLSINGIYSNNVIAAGDSNRTIDQTVQGAKDFISGGEREQTTSSGETIVAIKDDEMKEGISFLYNTFLAIGLVILVIWGLVIAIQIMTGSVEQKAQVKQRLIPYVAGATIIFGAYGIWRLVINIINNLS